MYYKFILIFVNNKLGVYQSFPKKHYIAIKPLFLGRFFGII
jgi:hypothetical protein